MVVREELLEDLFHLLQATQWPNDKNNSTLARNGANRVPKPPRTPHTSPTFHREVVRADHPHPPTEKPSTTQNDPKDPEKEKESWNCFDLEMLMSSLDPKNNMDIQSQYIQCDPTATYNVDSNTTAYRSSSNQHTYSFSKSIANQQAKHSITAKYPSRSQLARTPSSNLSESGHISSFSVSQSSTSALGGGPPSSHVPQQPLQRQLSTQTQQVLQLLLCDVFAVDDEELQKYYMASHRRKGADVSLELTLETTGDCGSVQGNMRLLGGKAKHERELQPPLPPTFTTVMPVDNLWSQQLLVRFSRNRKVMIDNSNKFGKKSKVKKSKKSRETDDSIDQSASLVSSKSFLDLPSSKKSDSSFSVSKSFCIDDSLPSHAPSMSSIATDYREGHLTVTPKSSMHKTHDKSASATLQRGMKGIRRSFRKKKKPKDDECVSVAPSLEHLNQVQSIDGIPIENISTPKKEALIQVGAEGKSSKSPLQRFGSLKVGSSDFPFKRLNKLKRSLRVGGSNSKIYTSSPMPTIVDGPITSKEELITTSQPLLDKSSRLESSNPFAENSGDELDSRNPFTTIRDCPSDMDDSNPFKKDRTESSPFSSKSKSKSIRKSMRKTMSRIASVRKGKKGSKEKETEEIPLNIPDSSLRPDQDSKEHANNLINTEEHNVSITELRLTNTPDFRKDPRRILDPNVELKLEPPTKFEVITEELAYKLLQLQDAAARQSLDEHFDLVDGLRVVVTMKLSVTFSTKCSAFDLYKHAFQSLYRRRFIQMIPLKMPLEGVDCNATVDGEVLLKQLGIFCPMSPLRTALARFLVLVDAATGKMGTPNTINAMTIRKRNTPQGSFSDSTHVVEVHQKAPVPQPRDRTDTGSSHVRATGDDGSGTTDAVQAGGSGNMTPTNDGSPVPSVAGSVRLSTSSVEEPADEFVYDQKAETIMINPSDLLMQLQRVDEGLSVGVYSPVERNEALNSVVCLSRWIISHHLERLQTVFPVSGGSVTSKNLADTLRCLQLVETSDEMRERFDAETSDLGLGGAREHVLRAVKKYTELWVAALIRETTHRIDTAMKEQETVMLNSSSTAAGGGCGDHPSSISSNEDKTRTADNTYRPDEDGKLAFGATGMSEVVPAMVSSFVRKVKMFDNNELIVSLADMVEKRLGTNRPQLQTGTLATDAALPMLTYQQKEALSATDDDEIAELVLRLDVVGNLMPVIVDFLDVAKHFYDPIFKEFYELQFLEESWQVLVDGALALWRQIGSSASLRDTLLNPPLKPALLPQAISAVWSLCFSYSSINSLGGGIQPQHMCQLYNDCMEDCVMCWLQLIGQRAELQLRRDVQQMTYDTQYSQLEDLTRDTLDLIKLVVDKFECLVWPDSCRPHEVLYCLGYQLVTHLDTFWKILDTQHRDCGRKPNTISYWSCRILDSVTELRDAVVEALERLDATSADVQKLIISLDLMPHKAAQNMCYKELSDVELWVSRAASGDGGGALVQRLDEALHELYDCLAPAQPLVACLRDRILDATQAHLDEITQEEEFIQMAAVLQALREFFTHNILLEESLQAAVIRWEEQLSDARERGRPLAELQHGYYSQRFQEQLLQQLEDQSACTSLLVNIVFVEGYGLCASIVQAPSAVAIVKAAHVSPVNNNNNPSHPDAAKPPLSAAASGRKPAGTTPTKTTGMFSNIFKGAAGIGSVYVKAQLVPADWFPTSSLEYKTQHCKDDPAVIDEEINFPSVLPSSPGVSKGGYLLLRLKLSRRLRSHVVSEALIPLQDTPLVTIQNKRSCRHTQLTLTKPAALHTYESLNILKRRNDEVSSQFLSQLEQDNKGQQKAAIRGSNTSLSLWSS